MPKIATHPENDPRSRLELVKMLRQQFPILDLGQAVVEADRLIQTYGRKDRRWQHYFRSQDNA